MSLFDGVQILMARECRFQIYNSYLHIKKYLREYLMSKFIQLINRFINYHHSGCDTEGGPGITLRKDAPRRNYLNFAS